MLETPRDDNPDAFGSVDYTECGAGPTVVLLPGSCSTGAAWRPVIAASKGSFRFVTTSLLGYGGTAERRTQVDTAMSYESEMIEEVIGRTRSCVHLVGHSYGALVALAVVLRAQAPVVSLTVIEAPAMELLREQGEEHDYEVFRRLTKNYFAAFQAGDRQAIGKMIDFYGGPGTFASWPERVRTYAVETTPVNILDWSTAFGFSLTAPSLAKLDLPVLVIRGGNSPAAVQRANALVAQHIGRAELVTVEDASHFLIASHASEVSALITEHVSAA